MTATTITAPILSSCTDLSSQDATTAGPLTAWERREYNEGEAEGYTYRPEEDERLCWAA